MNKKQIICSFLGIWFANGISTFSHSTTTLSMDTSPVNTAAPMSSYGQLDEMNHSTGGNVTTSSIDDDTANISLGISIAGTILGIAIIAVGAFGNVLIILAVILSKPLCKSSNIYVVSLAMCDLFQSVMVKPLYIHTYVAREWKFGPQVCLYALYASNLALLESMLHVSAIAFHRYVIIVHPRVSRRFQSLRGILFLLVLIYLLPIFIVLFPGLSRLSEDHIMGVDVVFNKKIMFCSFVRHSDFRITSVIKKVVFQGLAAIFLFYCYIRIYHVVRISGQSINTQGTFSPSRLRREITLLKTVIVVFLTFVATYLPLSVVYGIDKHRNFHPVVYFIAVLLLWVSSSINWAIYGLMNRQYFQAYRYILCGVTVAATSVLENGSASKLSQNQNYLYSFRYSADHRRMTRTRIDSGREYASYSEGVEE